MYIFLPSLWSMCLYDVVVTKGPPLRCIGRNGAQTYSSIPGARIYARQSFTWSTTWHLGKNAVWSITTAFLNMLAAFLERDCIFNSIRCFAQYQCVCYILGKGIDPLSCQSAVYPVPYNASLEDSDLTGTVFSAEIRRFPEKVIMPRTRLEWLAL